MRVVCIRVFCVCTCMYVQVTIGLGTVLIPSSKLLALLHFALTQVRVALDPLLLLTVMAPSYRALREISPKKVCSPPVGSGDKPRK